MFDFSFFNTDNDTYFSTAYEYVFGERFCRCKNLQRFNSMEIPDADVIITDALIDAIRNRKIKVSDVPFAFNAYAKKILRNYKINKVKQTALKKVTTESGCYYVQEVVDSNPTDLLEETPEVLETMSYSAYREGKVINEYDLIDKKEDFMFALTKIKSINKALLIEEGVDLIECIKGAGKGIAASISTLRDVCSRHKDISELVFDILSRANALDTLECI